jgi:nickel-dependent lactate racemase
MKIDLNYGKKIVSIDIPDSNFLGMMKPKDKEGVDDPAAEVERALAEPIGRKGLKALVSPDDRVVILVSDITRPAPSKILLPPILEEIKTAGIGENQVKIVFGLGVHRKQIEEEKKDLVGKKIYERIECIDHDIEDCEQVGVTSRGTKAEVFRKVLEADFVIATGSLEFHYFAGYSGGVKALAPGVCSRATIESNHSLFLHPGAKAGMLKGNPLREELEEIAAMVGVDFMVNAVLNPQKEIIKVVAGDVTAAHRAGVEYIDRIFRLLINEPADIVITSPGGFPKDINLYQAHKAMQNALPAVKKGGIILTVACCKEGIGEENFARALSDNLSLNELVGELKQKFIQGRHIASQMAKIQLEHKIYLVSDLTQDVTKDLFFRCFDSPQKALSEALKIQGKDAKVLVIPYGISCLPYLKTPPIY